MFEIELHTCRPCPALLSALAWSFYLTRFMKVSIPKCKTNPLAQHKLYTDCPGLLDISTSIFSSPHPLLPSWQHWPGWLVSWLDFNGRLAPPFWRTPRTCLLDGWERRIDFWCSIGWTPWQAGSASIIQPYKLSEYRLLMSSNTIKLYLPKWWHF